jgi:hypothetical protein
LIARQIVPTHVHGWWAWNLTLSAARIVSSLSVSSATRSFTVGETEAAIAAMDVRRAASCDFLSYDGLGY